MEEITEGEDIMSHFDVPFFDKNSERLMLSKRIKQILKAINKKYFILDSVDTGDFFIRDGQYSFSERDKGKWKAFKAGKDYWGYKECYCWFKQTVKIPESFKGQEVIYEVVPRYERWDGQTNPQLIIWVNGKLMQGLDRNHHYVKVTNRAKGGEELEIYINAHADARDFDGELQMSARLQIRDEEAVAVYYDIATPLEASKFFDCDSNTRVNMVNTLNTAVNMLDIDSDDINSFHKSAAKVRAFLDENLYGRFEPETAWCIGHTHIDVAWLWRLRQTREKAARTFATVVKYMDEYPEYKFMSSQAQLYDYVKQDYPELYKEIKKRVKEGKWEPEGSMWVEADTNVASGEALVRQFLVGKRFFKKEFGVDNKIMWLPDVFGYSAAIPQLIKKSGMEYFMTTKVNWSEYNKFPFDTFMWRGIDGTEVLSHFAPTSRPSKDEHMDYGTTYNGYLSPEEIIGGYKRYSQKDLGKDFLVTYGFGDGGGGPTIDMLEHGKRMARGIEGCPVVKQAHSIDFFKHLDEQVSSNSHLPVWSGELYLELHRGTLTSQARNKKYNRKSECLYQDVETLCSIANKKCGLTYPKDKILENWKFILLNQFHDILPGSSIKEVYDDSKIQYESVLKDGCEMASEAQGALVSKISLKNDSLVIFNTTGFSRRDAVVADAPEKGDFALFDSDENEISYQKTYDGKIIFIAEVPPKGYTSYSVKKSKPSKVKDISATAKKAETKAFSVSFDKNGNIGKLVHKESGRSVAPEGMALGKVVAYQDRPHEYEAWDVKCYFDETKWELDFVKCELIEKGAVRAVYKVTRKFRKSEFSEYYIIYNDLERIDIEYKTDWKENHVVLKADYPVDVNATRATFDIQFGNIERSTTRNTTWDFAQFEESMHKWIDLSDNSFGLSVINDCKYGCDIKDGHMRPTLLRCATEPNTVQDREYHEFTFSVYPHSGRACNTNLVGEAYNVNYPMYAVYSKKHEGALPAEYSLVNSSAGNVVIETVKMAEDSSDIIVRAFETWNEKTECTLTFADEIKSVTECNLLEEQDVPADFCGKCVAATFKPFEIKTFRIKFK